MAKNNPQTKILLATLPNVAFDGWTEELLSRAAKKAGLKAEKVFPDGVTGLVAHFSDWADAEMQKKLGTLKKTDIRIRDKIALGVQTRLDLLAPHKHAVSSALAYMARPPRNFMLPKMVWRTADKIWDYAGDTSTDYNRYTKRFLLSGVITATTLYWLNDNSKNHAKTGAFLDKRLDNVLKIGQKISALAGKKRA